MHEKNLRLEISLPQPDPFTVQTEPKIFCKSYIEQFTVECDKISYTGSIIKINGWKQDGKKTFRSLTRDRHPKDIKEHLFTRLIGRIGTQGTRNRLWNSWSLKSFIELLGAHIKLESKAAKMFFPLNMAPMRSLLKIADQMKLSLPAINASKNS